MKKLTYIEAKTENNQSLLHFEIPNYSEIKKIEYVYHTSRYRALVLIDETFAIRSLKDKTKTETYQMIGLNQEIDTLTGTNLIIVSRNEGDVYLLKKIVEPRDDLDRAQDIFEFNEGKEWTDEDELCDFCCNASRLDAIYYFKVREIIKHPRLKWKVRALNSIIEMRKINNWCRCYPTDIPF